MNHFLSLLSFQGQILIDIKNDILHVNLKVYLSLIIQVNQHRRTKKKHIVQD